MVPSSNQTEEPNERRATGTQASWPREGTECTKRAKLLSFSALHLPILPRFSAKDKHLPQGSRGEIWVMSGR